MHNLSNKVLIKRLALDGTTTYTGVAGTTALTTEGIDTRGYEGVMLKVAFGTITSGAVTSIKAQQSSDDGATDGYSDLEGTSQTVADTDDGKVFIIDIHRPTKRYIDLVISRGTQNAVVDYMEVVLYNPFQIPVTADATVGGIERHVSPNEGTA